MCAAQGIRTSAQSDYVKRKEKAKGLVLAEVQVESTSGGQSGEYVRGGGAGEGGGGEAGGRGREEGGGGGG